MKQTITLLLFLAANTTAVFAQKYSNEFLQIGIGARAQAMGHTGIALTNGAYSAYWNPAALANQTSEIELAAMHTEWFAGVGKYDYLGATYRRPESKHTFGASLIRFGVDDIPNTLSLYDNDGNINIDNVVPFSAADYALIGSYARGTSIGAGQLNYGGNAKIIYRHIGSFAQSFGFGLDAGIQLKQKHWVLGLTGRDLTGTFNAWSFSLTPEEEAQLQATENSLPINSVETTKPTLSLGVAYVADLGTDWTLQTELDLIATTDGQRNTLISADPVSLAPNVGIEATFRKMVSVRAGAHQWQRDSNLDGTTFWTATAAVGVGIKFRKWQLDYAFASPVANGDKAYTHVVSLAFALR